MTSRTSRTKHPSSASLTQAATAGTWRLQDAKARFSEVVRNAQQHGPQHVTLHGREAVVVIAAADFRRLQGERTGQVLIDALQASPLRETDLAPARLPLPVRRVAL